MGNKHGKVRRSGSRLDFLTLPDVRTELLAKIDVNIGLVTHMARHLNLTDEEYLKHDMFTNSKKVDYLLTVVKKKGLGAYKAMCTALDKTLQPGALDVLRQGEKCSNFDGHRDATAGPSGETNVPKRIWSIKDQTICNRRQVQDMQHSLSTYHRQLNESQQIMKGLTGYTHFTTDLTQVYTELQLETKGKGMWKETSPITLLEALEGREKNYLFTGSAGVGKSSALLQITALWEEYLERKVKELKQPCFENIEMLILLRPACCVDSLNDSVKEALRRSCGAELSENYLAFFHAYTESTAIVIESLDEIYHLKTLISDIEEEMRSQQRTLIMASRSNHPVTDSLSDMVSLRRVKVLGFDDSKICEYIEKFLSMKPELSRELQDTVSTDEEFRGLLHNPLILALVCLLIHQESVSVQTLSSFTKFKIFEAIESMLIRREKINPTYMKQFHELVLTSVLDEAIIYRSSIDDICPQLINLSYLDAEDINDPLKAWKGQVITWSHVAFQEYGAAKALKECNLAVRNRLLTLITSKRKLNYVLDFSMGMLQLSTSEVKGILNTILATQLDMDITEVTSGEECFCTRNRQIRELDQLTASLILQGESTSMDDDLTTIIPCRDCLKITGLLASEAGITVLSNCFDVFTNIRLENYNVFQEVIAPLLPATWTWTNGWTCIIIPAPHHARCVVVADGVDPDLDIGVRQVEAADYKDIVEADVLHSPRLDQHRELEYLSLDTDITRRQTKICGTEILPPDHSTYHSLLTYLPQTPCLIGRGLLVLDNHPSYSWAPLLQQLPHHLTNLRDWGLRHLVLVTGRCRLEEVKELLVMVQHQGWQVEPGIDSEGVPGASLRKGSQEVALELFETKIQSCQDEQLRQELEATAILRCPDWSST